MEAYNRALREGTAQQSQAIGALQEGDTRQLLGAIGKVNAVGVDQIAGLTDEMAQKMFDKSKLQAQEGILGADDLAKIYEDRALGAQKAAGAAELAQFGALNSALIGVTDFATRIDAGRNEYKKSQAMPAISNTGANISGVTGTGDGYNFVNTSNQSPISARFPNQSKFIPSYRTQTGGSGLGAISGYDPNVFGTEQSIFSSVSTPKPKSKYVLPNYFDPYTGEYIPS